MSFQNGSIHGRWWSGTIHFITNEFKLESCLFMLELEEIVDQWGLLRSKLVRDNENIFHAINDLEWPHVSCVSQTLELVVLEAVKIPEMSIAIWEM